MRTRAAIKCDPNVGPAKDKRSVGTAARTLERPREGQTAGPVPGASASHHSNPFNGLLGLAALTKPRKVLLRFVCPNIFGQLERVVVLNLSRPAHARPPARRAPLRTSSPFPSGTCCERITRASPSSSERELIAGPLTRSVRRHARSRARHAHRKDPPSGKSFFSPAADGGGQQPASPTRRTMASLPSEKSATLICVIRAQHASPYLRLGSS